MQHKPVASPAARLALGTAAVQDAEPAREHPEVASLLTEAQRTLTYDANFGGHRTTPVESTARDIDDGYTTAENAAVPLFTAEVVVTNWKALEAAQADGRFRPGATVDGRFTELWVSHGHTTGTVTPAKGREIAQAMRDFAARLDALCDVADEIAADDYEARG